MSSKLQPKYSWDSCVFLAWFKQESCHPLAEIDSMVRRVDAGVVSLVLSVIVIPEILESTLTEEQRRQFNEFLRRPNIVPQDVNLTVAKKAHSVRDLARQQGIKVTTADAIIIATAIVTECDELYSLDANGQGSPLQLSETAIVSGLKISKPDFQGQRNLF